MLMRRFPWKSDAKRQDPRSWTVYHIVLVNDNTARYTDHLCGGGFSRFQTQLWLWGCVFFKSLNVSDARTEIGGKLYIVLRCHVCWLALCVHFPWDAYTFRENHVHGHCVSQIDHQRCELRPRHAWYCCHKQTLFSKVNVIRDTNCFVYLRELELRSFHNDFWVIGAIYICIYLYENTTHTYHAC